MILKEVGQGYAARGDVSRHGRGNGPEARTVSQGNVALRIVGVVSVDRMSRVLFT